MSQDLPSRVADGVRALQERRWADAAEALGPVAADADLRASAELADVRARVLSLHAQALLELARLEEADAACREALRVLRRLADREGTEEVRTLQDRVVAALAERAEAARRAAEQAAVASTPVEVLLAGSDDPLRKVEVLVKKATACADAGRPEEGIPLAREGLDGALALGSVTWEVFARVALARLLPAEATSQLAQAAEAASRADEFNLVSVIVSAARLLGVPLPTHPGAHAPAPGRRP